MSLKAIFETSQGTIRVFSSQGFQPRLLRWKRQLEQINGLESSLQAETDTALRRSG